MSNDILYTTYNEKIYLTIKIIYCNINPKCNYAFNFFGSSGFIVNT